MRFFDQIASLTTISSAPMQETRLHRNGLLHHGHFIQLANVPRPISRQGSKTMAWHSAFDLQKRQSKPRGTAPFRVISKRPVPKH